jgi:hypothetical protein
LACARAKGAYSSLVRLSVLELLNLKIL